MGAVIYWHMQLIHGQTKQQNKLTSFRVYLVVSTLNLQHSLKLLVIFKVAFWDDWPSFIWRRAVFCSTLSIWHHLASIIMQFHCFILGVPPYQICLYLKVSLQSLSCLKLKLETFHMALVQNLTQSSAFTLLPNFTNVTGWNTNHGSMSTVLYRWRHTLNYSCHWLL